MQIIKSDKEISYLFQTGKRYKCPYITFIVKRHSFKTGDLKQQDQNFDGRVAFIAGKKIGNSVFRNSARRRMRALCRDIKGSWPELDIIFLARSSILSVPYYKVLSACEHTLRQIVSKNGKVVGKSV